MYILLEPYQTVYLAELVHNTVSQFPSHGTVQYLLYC